jgi:hypothetical protein
MPSLREHDHRGEAPRGGGSRYLAPILATPTAPLARVRRHHFHDMPPWPHQSYQDYAPIEGWGWWPRWYPYWDPQWRTYWWYLYDYYGGDGYPEYAEYARDAVLRANASQWGLVVGGAYGTPYGDVYEGTPYGALQAGTSYGTPQVGIQPYGVAPAGERSSYRGNSDRVFAYRGIALDAARKISSATGSVFFGYRDSPWGTELTVFGTRPGLHRWANEQSADADVWYAAAFDLSSSLSPLAEVSR